MKRIVDACLAEGASSAQIFTLDDRSESFGWSAGRLDKISSENIVGHNLTVNGDGRQISLAFTGDGDGAAARAAELLPHAGKAEYDFPEALEPAVVDGPDEAIWATEKSALMAMGERLLERARSLDPEASVGGGVGRSRQRRRITNSKGVEVETTRDFFSIGVSLSTASAGDIFQIGASRAANRMADFEDEIFEELRVDWERGREVVSLEGGAMPVLLLPSAVAQLSFAMAGLMGNAFHTGTSPFVGRIGEAIMDEGLSLVDDGTMAGGRLSHAFDDEGTAGQRTVLVRDGVLVGPIVNLRSAAKLDLAPTGNGLRNKFIFNEKDFTLGAAEGWTNLRLEGGTVPLEDMLASVDEGIAIASMFGLVMGNTVQGEVSSSIDTGYRIRKGRIAGRVKGRAIGANLYTLLTENLEAVEDRLHEEAGVAGSFHVPHVLLKDVRIA